ncbi:unnamed protein product [Sphagnum jensenii]|uniref:Uncharacterized protein n=1 Tax=Sphagnum jensenii TaxID=128206 RepID=A0ABP0XG79_9BRYO
MILAWYRLTQMLVPTHTNLFIFEIEQEWQNWVGWSWARLHCHFFWLRGLRQQHYESLDMVSILETYCLSTHPCQFRGEKTVDALVEWAATSLLKLPRILYYGAKGLVTHNTHYLSNSFMTDVIQKTGLHKVKGQHHTFDRLPSSTGIMQSLQWCFGRSRATHFGRPGVKSAPAVVFVKDPGLEPVIYHGMNCLPSLPLLIL